MNSTFEVGVVWSVKGNEVIIKMYNVSSDFVYFYDGEEYEGIRNGGYLSISRGHIDIICQIESEEIKDNYINIDLEKCDSKELQNKRYEKFVYAKCIGFFEKDEFTFGVKYSPVIYNTVKMLNKESVKSMFNSKKDNDISFVIGKELQYEVDISLPWNRIFNTHIGVFGNTGSGKSNTLTKLYTTLFNHEKLNLENSKFTVIDFNGEYVGETVLTNNKKVYKLNTRSTEDKFEIKDECFWNEEVLGVLFHATEKTQKPFLKSLITQREKYKGSDIRGSLLNYLKQTYKKIFTTQNPKREALELMNRSLEFTNHNSEEFKNISWHSSCNSFLYNGKFYTNDEPKKKELIQSLNIDTIALNKINHFDELQIRVNLSLINGILKNHVQYDNVNPLLLRISSASKALEKIVDIVEEVNQNENIKIISLRGCNQEIKKLFPILLAKEYFREHKIKNEKKIKETFHLIIDEAHNILSHQSNREAESWKDYRLELFEEIIKEGRKFGFFLTISSQRPADISETIMSQFHNFFIHRLINDKDLRLIDNVISTLDRRSKLLIPTLPQGACITTGTSFDFPQIIQVDRIEEKDQRPNSDDIDLEEIWNKGEINGETGV
ncbi:MAG: ATP-binding protein [Cetobacterium sp.]